jgi:DNA adenine methylase
MTVKPDLQNDCCPSTPFLRWAGSKRKLLPQLRRYWRADFGRYIEPFMGSACLFFEIAPSNAILADLNSDLIETFVAVKHRVHQLYDTVSSIARNERTYYKLRSTDPSTLPFVKRAARFVYLNRFCFNGIYRTNNSGRFNVPYGGLRTGALPPKSIFENCARRLKCATLCSGDFATIVENVIRPKDFVYLDPPFAIANRRIHTQYNAHSFGKQDLARLSKTLDIIHEQNAYFALSYADCPEARQFFSRWPFSSFSIQRNVAGFAIHRSSDTELIFSNIEF